MRSVRARIETRSARLRLSARKEPYWQKLERGLSAGYHRPFGGGSGTWWGRKALAGRYRIESLAVADDYQDADGETALDWAQAQAAVRAWSARVAATGPYTVAHAVAAYIDDLRARKGETAARGAELRLARNLLPTLGARQLAALRTDEVLAWRNSLVRDGDAAAVRRSRDTANRTFKIAKAAFNLAFNTGRVPDDRSWRRVGMFKGAREARKVIFAAEQIQRLVDACGPGVRELVIVGAETGARLGELTSARVRDFDPQATTLAVSGKTGPREIQLAATTVALLRRLASGKKPDEHLLTDNGRPWRRNMHSVPFARAVAKAGLDAQATYYALRHSYISGALKAGVPTQAIAQHCGTSAQIIESTYAKFVQRDMARYVELVAQKLHTAAEEKVIAIRPGGVA